MLKIRRFRNCCEELRYQKSVGWLASAVADGGRQSGQRSAGRGTCAEEAPGPRIGPSQLWLTVCGATGAPRE
ncbi:hypothetical protein MHYP_G00363440 [Metynnis hypsauchen]